MECHPRALTVAHFCFFKKWSLKDSISNQHFVFFVRPGRKKVTWILSLGTNILQNGGLIWEKNWKSKTTKKKIKQFLGFVDDKHSYEKAMFLFPLENRHSNKEDDNCRLGKLFVTEFSCPKNGGGWLFLVSLGGHGLPKEIQRWWFGNRAWPHLGAKWNPANNGIHPGKLT